MELINVTSEVFEKLRAPFEDSELDWRILRSGSSNGKPWALIAPYVDARAVQNRLDQVVAPENWQVSYQKFDKAFICTLSIRLNGEWVKKEDGAEETDFEAFKGGLSSAFRRAAVPWGIGRYLYALPEQFAQIVEKGVPNARFHKEKDGGSFYWVPPKLLPKGVQMENGKANPPEPLVTPPKLEQKASVTSSSNYPLMTFGKYKGMSVEALWEQDCEYVAWVVGQKFDAKYSDQKLLKAKWTEFFFNHEAEYEEKKSLKKMKSKSFPQPATQPDLMDDIPF